MFLRMARKDIRSIDDFPTWVRTAGAIRAEGATVKAHCTDCGQWQRVDIERLIAAKGESYCLIDRRCRCTLTPGCAGWVRFWYFFLVMRPLWTTHAAMRWSATRKP